MVTLTKMTLSSILTCIFKFSEKAHKGRPTSEDTVEVVYYKDYSEVGEFTQDVFRYLRQSDQI